MKIVYLTIVDISTKNGQGIYAYRTLESFLKNKQESDELIVLLPFPSDRKYAKIIKGLEDEKIKIYFLYEKKINRSILWHLIIQLQILYILLFKIKKAVALIYSLKPTMIAPIIYSKIYKVPVYLLVEGLAKNSIHKITKGLFSKIGLYILMINIKNAKKVFPAYCSAKKWVDSIRGKNDSEIIYCGVDTEIFKPVSKEKNEKLTIGYVGSFRDVHKLDLLIDGIEGCDVKIVLIGNGSQKNKILNRLQEKNIDFTYLGELEQKDINKYFAKCDLMWGVTDKNHWGVPIKVFEYLACNKKVIFTKKTDFSFIEKNGWGYGLEDVSILEFKDILNNISNIQDNKNSRNYIEKNNNWNNFYQKIMKEIS